MTEDFSGFEVIKVLPEPLAVVSPDGEIISANPAFLRIFFGSGESPRGRILSQISEDSTEKISSYLQICSRNRQLMIGSLKFKTANGETHEYRAEGALVKAAEGNEAAKILLRLKPKEKTVEKFNLLTQKIDELNKEILERKQAEEESRRLLLEANEASRLKDEFLAVVSHELRTPLSSILGWARILGKETIDHPQAVKALETIERNALSQVQLIEDLLDVSRIITGKLRLDVQSVDLASVIEAAIETVRPSADNKSIRLQVILDPRAGKVSGDAGRLQQAIWNLLSNAIKFTPKLGRIQVRLERVNSHLEIIVSDNGVGIEPEFLPFVFDRFRQADASKTRTFGGLGLGLAITRHLIELHGGTVQAFSEGREKGATFTIALPLNIVVGGENFSQKTGARVHPTAQNGLVKFEPESEIAHLRLLVVEDYTDAREMLETLLQSCGAVVKTAASAAEGFELLQNNHFDILISDIEMPEADGYELIKKVRGSQNGKFKNIGAIALTAHARTTDRLQMLTAGFDYHVAKPFEPAELITIIASLYRRKKS